LIAEYQPQTNKYYYHTSDQVNSSRIVTDDLGSVVYSATYSPYGGIEKVFTESYNPNPKFSGKEREGYSGWDYFGARYYDHGMYRFTSVDPIINKSEALTNPQLWNLYAYCRNNPITYLDPDGRDILESVSNFVAGFGDTISFGLTSFARNQLQKLHGINAVDTESVSYVTGDSAGMVFDAFAGGKVVGYLLSGIRIGKVAKSLKFTKTAMRRMSDSNRYVPRYILAEAIVTGKRVVDPQDAKNAIKIVSSMFKSGKKYQLNIIYNKVKKIVMHFHYK